MYCRVQDLRYKDVINVSDGTRLGCVCDVEVDTVTARICAIVIYGRLRWCGILGREEDIIITWDNIQLIGEDTILVNFCCPSKARSGNKFYGIFG